MYHISEYIVSQPINSDEILLYSTLSTSLVVLNKEVYDHIFNKKKFSNYVSECQELCEMGFLFQGNENAQIESLMDIRRDIVNSDNGITAITIAPTMECNARCYYCFENGAEKGTMTKDTADRVVDFLLKRCIGKELYIAWFGGEPLMAAEVIDYITSKLSEADIRIESTVTTNGILINEEMLDYFHKWKVTRVQITLDGLGEEYNKIKNYTLDIEDPFEQIMQNIELLIRNQFNVHLRINYKSDTCDVVDQTMDYLHQRFGDYEKLYLYGAPVDLPTIKGYSEFTDQEGEIYLKVLRKTLENGYENDELNFSALRVSPDYNVALGELKLAPFPANCFMVNKNRYVIDDAGKLYKCQKHLGKSEFSCGDVFNGEVENDTYHYYVTAELHDKKCLHCNMFPICQGGCNANRLLYGSKFACPPTKSIINQLVKKYYEYVAGQGY